jgi:hypothetical protein
MSVLVINSQYRENYNVSGEGEPYWKFKGGSEYVVDLADPLAQVDQFQAAAKELIPLIEYANEMSEEYVLGWRIESHDFVPGYEDDQKEWDGEVYYEPRISQVDGEWKQVVDYVGPRGSFRKEWIMLPGHEEKDYSYNEFPVGEGPREFVDPNEDPEDPEVLEDYYNDYEEDYQPTEYDEWMDFDPDC